MCYNIKKRIDKNMFFKFTMNFSQQKISYVTFILKHRTFCQFLYHIFKNLVLKLLSEYLVVLVLLSTDFYKSYTKILFYILF